MKKFFSFFSVLLVAHLLCACGQLDLGNESKEKAQGETIADEEQALTIAEAQATELGREVVVAGYYVGYVKGTSMGQALLTNFLDAPNTNLLLADDSVYCFEEDLFPVELPKGTIRDELNLLDHPDLYRKRIVIRGTLDSYFRVAGLKSPTAWQYATGPAPEAEPKDSIDDGGGTEPVGPEPVVVTFPKVKPLATPVSRGR